MKLIKIKTTKVEIEEFSFVIDGLNIKLDSSDEIRTRTRRIDNVKKALYFLKNPDPWFVIRTIFTLFKNEEIIYEIEFNKPEELLEVIPEEFL